ncbi:MAG TPA: MFS transporter [Chloroflexota bacterium]|nr:MFS transporter [Chloroflexota bacterium]
MGEELPRRWLNRNVLAIGFADLMADFNYEMVLAVLPLFITAGLGAPAAVVGLVEGVADGSSALIKLWSGWFSDRIPWRRHLGTVGYGCTVVGFGTMNMALSWPQVLAGRSFAWIGRGLRQPIRSAMLAGSVERRDLGKAFGFHQAMDTLGALLGPGVAFWLLYSGQGFRPVFLAAIVPGLLAVLSFGLLPRDPRKTLAENQPRWQPLPRSFWRFITAVAVFGAGNFAIAFFTLRALEMLRPSLGQQAAIAGAVLFFLAHNAVGAAVSFPAGWLADRIGKPWVLATGYAAFAVACVVAIFATGPAGVGLLAIPAGVHAPLVDATEGSLASELVADDRRGTAFGVLHGVNGAGDLLSSVVVGALWSSLGAAAGLTFGAVLGLAGAGLLLILTRPKG